MKIKKSSSILKQVLNGLYRVMFSLVFGIFFNQRLLECTNKFRTRTIFFIVLFVIVYISLNNYLIMFVYIKMSTPTPASNIRNSREIHSDNWFSFQIKSFFSIFESSIKKNVTYEPQKKTFSGAKENNFSIFIDPQDLNEINMSKISTENNFLVLKESYFEENEEKHNTPHKLKRVCFIPKLSAFNAEIMQFVKKEQELKCNPKQNWVWVENGTLRISNEAIKKHGQILCAYLPLYRGNNDFVVNEGKRIFPVMDQFPIITDFFKVDCRSKDGGIYSNIHSGISYDSSLHMRHIWNPLPRSALGYDVLMFGFDSVSRLSWIRMLPKTYEYMIKQGFVVLKGYNIVGDGTPQNLLPILTGKTETELPEARRGFHNGSFVDSFPWIFKDYKKAGYVTQWAEDMQSIGTFQLRMLGFRNQPVDHFMRVFYLEAERYYERFRRLCLGSLSRHQNIMNWAKDFFQMYASKPKFSFIFHSEASHNYNNPLSLLDDDLKNFLVHLKQSGIMESTILLFMSDHGVRVSSVRQYSQGKLEERLPFFSIRMPQTFQKKHSNEMRNLRLNARKLTTPFDVYETLKHFLNFQDSNKENNYNEKKPKRGYSLLSPIPIDRSCKDAHIESHWCSCLNWVDVNITANDNFLDKIIANTEPIKFKQPLFKNVKDQKIASSLGNSFKSLSKSSLRIAHKAVDFINSLIDPLREDCDQIYLKKIESLSLLNLNEKLLAFKESKDRDGREPVFEYYNNSLLDTNYSFKQAHSEYLSVNGTLKDENIKSDYVMTFQIVLITWPRSNSSETMKYEMTFNYDRTNNLFKFGKNQISRINNYYNSSYCILNKRPDLRQFCFCRL